MNARSAVTTRTLALILAAGCALTSTAKASDVSALQSQLRAALRSAKSFVAVAKINPMWAAPTGATITWTVVAPDRFRQYAVGAPQPTDDTIIIGHEVYGSNGGKPWTVQTWDDRLVTGFEGDVFDIRVVSAGDGSYVAIDPLGRSDKETMNCTYDKQTFRTLTCSNNAKTITFSRYDDPSVAIPTPANARRTDAP
jgi:hypothetical protein